MNTVVDIVLALLALAAFGSAIALVIAVIVGVTKSRWQPTLRIGIAATIIWVVVIVAAAADGAFSEEPTVAATSTPIPVPTASQEVQDAEMKVRCLVLGNMVNTLLEQGYTSRYIMDEFIKTGYTQDEILELFEYCMILIGE